MFTVKNLSFITPATIIEPNRKIVLEKEYSKTLQLGIAKKIYLSSKVGNRKNQQDTLAVSKNDQSILLIVADGMGGGALGEVASYYTAKIIQDWFDSEDPENLKKMTLRQFEEILYTLLYTVSTKLPNESGTTLTMSIVNKDKTFIANVGDSRTYTIGANEIILQTKDDSVAFNFFNPRTSEDRDRLRFYIFKNLITRVIDSQSTIRIKVKEISTKDYYSICHLTDGVTDVLSEGDIELFEFNSKNPAEELTARATYGEIIKNNQSIDREFMPYITRGEDNSTALIYKRKL